LFSVTGVVRCRLDPASRRAKSLSCSSCRLFRGGRCHGRRDSAPVVGAHNSIGSFVELLPRPSQLALFYQARAKLLFRHLWRNRIDRTLDFKEHLSTAYYFQPAPGPREFKVARVYCISAGRGGIGTIRRHPARRAVSRAANRLCQLALVAVAFGMWRVAIVNPPQLDLARHWSAQLDVCFGKSAATSRRCRHANAPVAAAAGAILAPRRIPGKRRPTILILGGGGGGRRVALQSVVRPRSN